MRIKYAMKMLSSLVIEVILLNQKIRSMPGILENKTLWMNFKSFGKSEHKEYSYTQ